MGTPHRIPRVPEGIDPRLRRFVDQLQVMYNSLVNGGYLVLDTDASGNPVLRIQTGLTDGHILVGDSSNFAADVAMSGDVTIVDTGATTIGANKVTNAKLAQAAANTLKGNNTGVTANEADLTVAQVNAMLGDILANGTVAFAADQSMGSHKLTNVTDPGSAQDAATKAYVDSTVGSAYTADEVTLHLALGVFSIKSTYVGQTSITTLGTIATGTWAGTTIAVNHGGTGATSLTAHGILLGEGTSAVTATTAMTDGQLLVGATGADPAPQTVSGAFTLSATGAATIATPGTLSVSSSNSTATAHTHAITSSSAPGAAASILATDASGIIGSTGTRIVKGWFTDLTCTNAIAADITGNAATVTTNANLTGEVTSSGNAATLDKTAITNRTADASPDAAADYVLTYDASAAALKKVLIQNLPTSGGVPTTITVANEASDTTCFPLFVTAATGDLGPKTNANLILDASTGILGAAAFVPSGSTAPTDGLYLPASHTLGFAINGAGEVKLTASALSPVTSDGNALGTAGLQWSDLFLASGAVCDFAGGDVTITHVSGLLTLNPGALRVTKFSLGSAVTAGVTLFNSTDATALATDQLSVAAVFKGSAWNGSAANTYEWAIAGSSAFAIYSQINSGGYNTLVVISAAVSQTGCVIKNGVNTYYSDSATTSTSIIHTFDHVSSGTPGSGFGSVSLWRLQDTTSIAEVFDIVSTWTTATHASRKGRAVLRVYDTAAREAVRMEASGTAAEIGFLGASAAAQQTGDAGTALVTFGLMSGTPTFAAANITGGAALTKTDDTNVTLTLGGTPASALLAAASITVGWSGQLAVSRGGTGASTLTAHAVVLGNGTSAVGFATIGTGGRLLIDQGAGADPAFTAVTGDITITSAGVTAVGANKVTNAMLAQMANKTYKGRHSSGTGNAEDVSVANLLSDLSGVSGAWTGQIYGFPYAWLSTTSVRIGCPNANGPTSICRDQADAAFISVASGTTYTVSMSTNGAILGDDSFQGAGTVAFNNSTTITGTTTAFKTAFGTRTLTGTSAVTAGTALVGTGTLYLTEVAVNDLVGNATGGWARVTAIADDTHLTLSQSLTLSSTCTCIEQPTITLTSDTASGGSTHQVDKIASDTSLLITEATAGGSFSGKSYFIGRHYARAAVTACQNGFIHLVAGASGTSAVISTQRTTTFAQVFGGSSGISGYTTSYRRLAACTFDSSGNVIATAQTGRGSERRYLFVQAQNTNGTRVLSAGSATTWTDVACNGCVPATARSIVLTLVNATAGGGSYVRPRSVNAYATTTATARVNGDASALGIIYAEIPCDGAQYIQYTNAGAAQASYIDSAGYVEDL